MTASDADAVRHDWIAGDRFGLPIPAHAEALREGGPAVLTGLFRTTGALDADNAVARITQSDELNVGGTGAKLLLAVEYAKPQPGLSDALFVKFSRNFDDVFKDRTRHHMEPEVRLALLSRTPGFPVAVPACLFADFHAESGTGILVTERVPFGQGAIEPQHAKCLDYLMPEPLEHYRALVRAIARLAGTHKAGRLPVSVAEHFPFDHAGAVASDRIRYDAEGLARRIAKLADFATRNSQIAEPFLGDPDFLDRFATGARLFLANQDAIKALLHGRPDLIALCHWNANADNAWFWRDAGGALECGLIDWGSVGQMPIAMTIWGCLSGAEPFLWDEHLDELLDLFATEFEGCGAPPLDRSAMAEHLALYVAMMGLAYLMDAPARIARELPDLSDIESRFDPVFAASETARVQLLMMSNYLRLWRRADLTRMLERMFG